MVAGISVACLSARRHIRPDHAGLIDVSAQSQADEHDLLQKAALNQDVTSNLHS
jgi:hypothetical protein